MDPTLYGLETGRPLPDLGVSPPAPPPAEPKPRAAA